MTVLGAAISRRSPTSDANPRPGLPAWYPAPSIARRGWVGASPGRQWSRFRLKQFQGDRGRPLEYLSLRLSGAADRGAGQRLPDPSGHGGGCPLRRDGPGLYRRLSLPSLLRVVSGARWCASCARRQPMPRRPGRAAFEWVQAAAFDAMEMEPLDLAQLTATPADAWPSLASFPTPPTPAFAHVSPTRGSCWSDQKPWKAEKVQPGQAAARLPLSPPIDLHSPAKHSSALARHAGRGT